MGLRGNNTYLSLLEKSDAMESFLLTNMVNFLPLSRQSLGIDRGIVLAPGNQSFDGDEDGNWFPLSLLCIDWFSVLRDHEPHAIAVHGLPLRDLLVLPHPQ